MSNVFKMKPKHSLKYFSGKAYYNIIRVQAKFHGNHVDHKENEKSKRWLVLPVVLQIQKKKVFFTKSYCQGIKVLDFDKSDRPRGPKPAEMIQFNKKYSSKESETSG